MQTQKVRASAIFALGFLVVVSGCTASAEQPTPTAITTPEVTATPEPDPEFIDGGTAGQNRPYFDFVLTAMLERNPRPSSQTVVNSLVAAGFDKAAMEVTADITPVGQFADSILVAVQIDGQCLVGQIIDEQLLSELADVLGTGRCLVGRTLSIDW
jgi:hypothetical protein